MAVVTIKRKRGNPKGNPNIKNAGKNTQFKADDPETGFKDPRINREGQLKPRSQRELEKLLDKLFDTPVEVKQGKQKTTMSQLELMLISMIAGNDPRNRIELLGRRFGKIRDTESQPDVARSEAFTMPADLISPEFLAVFRAIKAGNKTEYVLKGGRGSTKSSFVSLAIVYLLIKNPTGHALVMRQVANTIKDSVFSQIQWAILELGENDNFRATTSPFEMTYTPTGQKIYFRGADDPGKIKSIKPSFGAIIILWFEELDQFHGQEAVRKIEQSVIRGTDIFYNFKSFNPPRTSGNWANKYIQIPKETQLVHESTYLTVPPEWLGKAFIEEANHLKVVNPAAYEHEYLGVVNGTGSQVFENVKIRKITDKEIEQFDNVKDGLDFGFYPDPAHYGQCHYDAARRKLYIFGELRKYKTSNKDMYKAMKAYGYEDADTLICDSAEPKSVADFVEYGASARGAEKGKDSVKYSIKWLQSLVEIIIDNTRCPHTAEEFLDYQYEIDKDGELISEFQDGDDHAIAAIRYATNLIWRIKGK